ncbi:hypothetical protein CRG98_007857 [Punica granatum]|uniref:Uncharacterized protein n=1 Tax=Punica granatum TaxID=22663 RepID=A0A2I0KTB5_PUNGR|nr:hypothetical protein CRG98_007857 [Punica granatum]
MDIHGQDFRSQFPVLSVFRIPPLISQNPDLGPLLFDPVPSSLVSLLSSPSLLFPPQFPPRLSLPRFLGTTAAVPLSVADTVASLFGPQPNEAASAAFSHNRLRLLRCPSTGLLAAFFPTGENSDQLGFVVLESELGVQLDDDGGVFRSSKRFSHSIVRILVNPVGDDDVLSGNDGVIGYVMACTMYSVHWFAVRSVHKTRKIEVVYSCSKSFKSSAIAGACWSSQLPEVSAVLLDNGSLFLFDLEPLLYVDGDDALDCADIRGTRLKVSWNKLIDMRDKRTTKWLGCEFSWHPQILIVARSNAVFSLDFRSESCNVSCVAKIEMSGTYASVEKDRFLTFSMAGPDGFHFVVASNRLLILCDVRKPSKPILQWVHGIDKPCSIDVFKLSQLRSCSRDDTWASESGFGILLGSFWNCEFSLFCYGPHLPSMKGSCESKFSEMCKSFCAWELPTALCLSGRECRSGSCLVKEEFSKNDLPEWVDWRQKKDIVLGFGILGNDLSPVASEVDEFGGFTVVRLMSSGKLEAQRYRASWKFTRNLEEPETVSALFSEDNILDSTVDEGYKFVRIFHYIKLHYLMACLKGNLSSKLGSSLSEYAHSPLEKDSFNPEFHAILCEKLKMCGFTRSRSSPAISLVFDDISLPTTIREIALTRVWSELPVELLQLAFSSYSEFLEVVHGGIRDFYHDFSAVSELPQLPPYILRRPSCRSNKWSQRVRRSDDSIVGPVVPLAVLSSLQRLRGGLESETTEEEGLSSQCDEILQLAAEVARAESSPEVLGDHAVSLSDDRDEDWVGSQNKKKRFLLHEPGAFKPRRDDRFARLVSRVSEDEHVLGGSQGPSGPEMFDDLCPIKLRFSNRSPVKFTEQELVAYRILKKQFLKRADSVFGQ